MLVMKEFTSTRRQKIPAADRYGLAAGYIKIDN